MFCNKQEKTKNEGKNNNSEMCSSLEVSEKLKKKETLKKLIRYTMYFCKNKFSM